MTNNLPNWDLSTIYPSCTSKEFNDDLTLLVSKSNDLISSIKTEPLTRLISIYNEITALCGNLGSYALALTTTDSSNDEYLKAQSKVDEALLKADEAEKRFCFELKNRLPEIKAYPNADYLFLLNEMLSDADHQMSIEEEILASDLARSGGDAFSHLQDSLCASIEKDGETLISLRAKASDKDREVRHAAFVKEKALLKEHETAYAFALNGVKGSVLTLEKRRGWNSPLEHSAFCSRLSIAALNALIGVLEDNLPLFRDYLNTKAKALGLKKLSFYDLFAPVGDTHTQYSFEDAKKLVVDAYTAFSPDMGAFATYAFEHNWIDAPLHKGKVGGAYETSFPKAKECRVLTNFDYSYDSVSTLAHELGHAYHSHVLMDLDPMLEEYPMTLAETASIFGETLLFQNVINKLEGKERLSVLESTLSSGCQVCVDILSRFYFEQSAFEERKSGDVTPARFSALMLDAQNRTYGDALEEKHEYMWAVKSHYYSPEFSFYNYPYAFGQLFALSLYASGINKTTYVELLKKTGCMSADDVASSAGFDITKKEFWQAGMDVFASYLKMMKECL